MNQPNQPPAAPLKNQFDLKPDSFAMQIRLVSNLSDICRQTARLYGYEDSGVNIHKSQHILTNLGDNIVPRRVCYIEQFAGDSIASSWSFNVRIYGASSLYAEYEVINLAIDILQTIGLSRSDFVIKINNRMAAGRILNQWLGLDTVQLQMIMRLIDNKTSQSSDDFMREVGDIIGQNGDRLQKFYALYTASNIGQLPAELQQLGEMQQVSRLIKLIQTNMGVSASYEFLAMLNAGLYMGNVFKIVSRSGEVLCIGGCSASSPLGSSQAGSFVDMVVSRTVIKVFSDLNKDLPTADIGVVAFRGNDMLLAMELAKKMRQEGVKVDVDITDLTSQSQAKSYVQKQLPFVLFIDPNSGEDNRYRLYETKTGKTYYASIERITTKALDYRNSLKGGDDDTLFTLD